MPGENIGTASSSSDSSTTPNLAASTSSDNSDHTKIRISIDLITAARRHLSFLRSLSGSPLLHHAPTALRSIRRYEELWMPLVSDLSKGSSSAPILLPPLDIFWVWHCHCLNPVKYREYCASRFGTILERPAIFDDENEEYASNRCREIWIARYPSEPFDLDEGVDDGENTIADATTHCDGGLFAMIAKFGSLYSSFSDPFVPETVYLISARHRYRGFLHLSRRFADGGSRMMPTSDILLMWLTHQSFPGRYWRDIEGMGNLERRVVGFGDRAEEEEVEEMRRVWEEVFDEPYERAGAGFDPANSPSRLFFSWEASDAEAIRRCKALQPRFLMEVCVFLKGKWEEREAMDAKKTLLRVRTVRCHREMKIDNPVLDISSESWQKKWHLYCEFGTRGISIEVRKQGSSCLGNDKLQKTLVFLWNDLLRATSLTLTKELEVQVRVMSSVTPPVQAPYLLKCVPDRVTDDSGAMISDVILRMNRYHPQEGRWLSRTVLDHGRRECFVIRIRVGRGFWRRGAETPTPVKWEERIIEVREGPWSYVASSVGTASEKVVGTATPKEKDLQYKKAVWCLSTGDVLTIRWEDGLSFELEDENSSESMRLLRGRKLQYKVKELSLENKGEEEEDQYVTLVRFTSEHPDGKATALLNWKLLAVEFLPEEDAVQVLLLCMAIVRTVSEIRGEDMGGLLVRRRVKEGKVGYRDWGSVMLNPFSSSSPSSCSPHLQPWYWNAKEVLASAEMDNAREPAYKYNPADGKDLLYKQAIIP